MNKLVKFAVLAAGATLMSQVSQAQVDSGNANTDDLVLGFTSQAGGVTSDYVLDLGPVPTSNNTQLGGISLSTFNTIFGSASGVNVGVIGGNPYSTPADVTTSVLRGSANLVTTYTIAGGESAPLSATKNNVIQAAGYPISISLGQVSQTDATSWTQNIAQNPTTPGAAENSFASYLPSSANPMSTIGSGGTINLDLFTENTSTKTFSYVGDLALDLTGSTLSAVFDPTPTPEPTTCSLLAGAGLVAFAFRRQLIRKNA